MIKLLLFSILLVTPSFATFGFQSPYGSPYLGLQYNPYTSPLWGYGLGPQYGTLYGSLASNYLYGNQGPYGGVPSYAGYPGGYGVYGGFGALGYGTHGVVDGYNRYYGYDPYDYKARSSSDSPSARENSPAPSE